MAICSFQLSFAFLPNHVPSSIFDRSSHYLTVYVHTTFGNEIHFILWAFFPLISWFFFFESSWVQLRPVCVKHPGNTTKQREWEIKMMVWRNIRANELIYPRLHTFSGCLQSGCWLITREAQREFSPWRGGRALLSKHINWDHALALPPHDHVKWAVISSPWNHVLIWKLKTAMLCVECLTPSGCLISSRLLLAQRYATRSIRTL